MMILFEGVWCVNYRHLGPGARGKAARHGGARGGVDGTRGAQTLHWPTFCARPQLALECAALFRKSGTLAAEVSQNKFLATPQARESFFRDRMRRTAVPVTLLS